MFNHHSLIPWGSFRGRQEEKWGSFRGRDHFWGCTDRRLEQNMALSTGIRRFFNPQLFLSEYGFRPHAYGKFESEPGIFKSALQSEKK